MTEEIEVQCPVCRKHTMKDALESDLVFFTGVESVLTQDHAGVEQTFEGLTAYDGHTAITMYAILLADACQYLNQNPLEVIQGARKMILEQLNAEAA